MSQANVRRLKILAVVLLVLAFAGYFAFSTLLFSPLEAGLGNHVAGLVPRRTDFYLSKARLDRDFDGFPRLAVQRELEQNDAWLAFRASSEYQALAQELGVEQALAELEAATARLPLGIEPLRVFGGRQLAVAGRFRGSELATSDWAVYGTINWMGKLALELLRYPGIIGLERQGLLATTHEGYVSLEGAGLSQPLYLARIKDVGVIASTAELVQEARRLAASQFEDSLLAKAEYNDHVRRANRRAERDELEVFVDMRSFLAHQKAWAGWPDPASSEPLTALLGRVFQLGSMNELVGTFGTGRTLTLDLRAPLSSEVITPAQRKLYRTRGSDTRELEDVVARLAPADTGLLLYVKGDVGDLTRQVVEALDPHTRGLIEEAFRCTRKYQSLEQVLNEAAGLFRDRLVVLVRDNDYPPDPNAPPHDDTPVPAVALLAWTHDEQKVVQLRDTIGDNARCFGLQGVQPGEQGYYKSFEGGYELRELTSPLIAGTGHVLTVSYRDPDVTVVTNSKAFLGHVRRTMTLGGAQYPRLSDRADFQILLRSARPEGNLLLWLDPASLGKWLRARAEKEARESIWGLVDWSVERAKAEERVIAERFPGQRRGQLTPEVREQVDLLVNPMLDELRERVARDRVPELIAQSRRRIEWLEQVEALLVLIAFDPGALDVSARMVLPLAARQR